MQIPWATHRPDGSFVRTPVRLSSYRFLTPVWGKAYTKTYLELVMPAQLSAGNLGAFAGDASSRYVIYTTQADAQTIRASPAFRKLGAMIPAVIEIIDHEIVAPHDSMSICFRKGIDGALAADAAVVFLTPDLIFADGSLAALKRLCEGGCDVIFNPGMRTIKQGVTHTLLSKYEADGVLTVTPRDLMRVALDNIHPLSNSSWWEEGEGDLIPANLYWRVGAQGILAHCFHLHPLLVRAQRKNPVFFGTIDDDYVAAACPDASRDHIVVDSDELLMIEVSDATRFFGTGLRKGSIEDVASWAEQLANGRHRALFPIPIKMHAGLGDHAAWQAAEQRAKPIVDAVLKRLARPIWQLGLSSNGAFARMSRILRDNALAAANGTPVEGSRMEIVGAHMGRATSRFVMKGEDLVRNLRFLSSRLRSSLAGPLDKPPVWSMRRLWSRALARDLRDAIGTAANGVIISPDPHASLAHAIMGSKARVGVMVAEGDKQSLFFQDEAFGIPDNACDVVILDRILPRPKQAGAWIGELRRVVRPGGKLIVVANRFFDVDRPSRPESCTSIGNIEAMIVPEFSVVAARFQGGLGSTALAFAMLSGRLLLLRSRVLRLVMIILDPLLIPLGLIAALGANALALMIDVADRSGQLYFSSIVVGERDEPGE